MMHCPTCGKDFKLVKAGDQLVCHNCGYTDPRPAPTGKEFIVSEKTITFECGSLDTLHLIKEVTTGSAEGDKSFSREYILKQLFEEEPFVGSDKAKRYVVEASYKIKAIC